MKQLFLKVRLWLGKFQYKQAVRTAKRLYKKNGTRYYVLPADKVGKIMITDIYGWKMLQQQHKVSSKLDKVWLQRNALFYTEQDSTQMTRFQQCKKEQVWIKHLNKQLKKGE